MGMPRPTGQTTFLPHLATVLNDISSIGRSSWRLDPALLYNIYWTWKNRSQRHGR